MRWVEFFNVHMRTAQTHPKMSAKRSRSLSPAPHRRRSRSRSLSASHNQQELKFRFSYRTNAFACKSRFPSSFPMVDRVRLCTIVRDKLEELDSSRRIVKEISNSFARAVTTDEHEGQIFAHISQALLHVDKGCVYYKKVFSGTEWIQRFFTISWRFQGVVVIGCVSCCLLNKATDRSSEMHRVPLLRLFTMGYIWTC